MNIAAIIAANMFLQQSLQRQREADRPQPSPTPEYRAPDPLPLSWKEREWIRKDKTSATEELVSLAGVEEADRLITLFRDMQFHNTCRICAQKSPERQALSSYKAMKAKEKREETMKKLWEGHDKLQEHWDKPIVPAKKTGLWAKIKNWFS